MVTNIYYRMMNAPRRRGLQLGSLHGGGLDVVLDLVEGSACRGRRALTN
jgi:hypothetical protein